MIAQVSSVSRLLKGKKNGHYYKISFYTVPDHVHSHTYISEENYNFEQANIFEKNLLIRVDRVNHQLQDLIRFGLKSEYFLRETQRENRRRRIF